MTALVFQSQSLEVAYFSAYVSGYAVPNGQNYPAVTVTANTAGWATNAATQSAVVPLVTIPDGWRASVQHLILWMAGVPGTTGSYVNNWGYSPSSGALVTGQAQLPEWVSTAGHGNKMVSQVSPFGFSLITGAVYSDLSMMIQNTDVNAITVLASVVITAIRIV